MTDFDIVDDYFVKICDLPTESLDPDSAALVEVWHSFGVIQNDGLHGYLCEVGDLAHGIARRYEHLRLDVGSEVIDSALLLWRKYWPDGSPDDSDPDDFRSLYDDELGSLEERFYAIEDDVTTALARIAQQNQES
jgi:Domain of unknown function (DUF4375)